MAKKIIVYANELYHYGVLGQKWGVRRFQNEDGTLTPAGKERYGSDSILRNIARNEFNTSLGQRLMVNLNKGYKKDKKEIKELYKKKKEGVKDKEQLKSLKSDYKKTLGEARTTAAEVMYPWQGKSANQRIQTQSKGKAFLQSVLTGTGYGSMVYDRMRSNDYSRVASAGAAWVASIANAATYGLVATGQYVYEKVKSEKK